MAAEAFSMSDRHRLIGRRRRVGDRSTLFQQLPSSDPGDSSDSESYLVYQRGAPVSRERAQTETVEETNRLDSTRSGKKPLVHYNSNQREYRTITNPETMPNHERMDMDFNNGKSGGPTFSRAKGWFVERRWAYVMIIAVICALLLVGLLAGLLGRRPCSSSDQSNGEDSGTEPPITPEEALALRLPRGVVPLAYTIQLQPFLNGNLTVPGTMTLDLLCLQATNNITLNVLNVNVTDGSVHLKLKEDGTNGTVPNIKSITNDTEHQMIVFHLDADLMANTTYTINMTYVGLINDVLAGLYKSSYQSGNETKYLAVTQFEATDARRVFPCFDEPAFKATFDISIIREPNMTAVSNGPLIKTETRSDGWQVDHFGTTPKMSTYLVAIVISDFAYLNDSTYRVWARKDVIASAQYAVSIGPGIIRYYNNFFGIDYPMNKTDNVGIPDFNAGAMENWGLITYRETSLLFDPQLSTAYEKQYICQTVAHELAHQWFGNLVTPAWWNDLWLNEGFASYMEYVASDVVEPGWKMLELFITDKQQSALSLDGLRSSHPISVEVHSPSEINDLFDGISYDKGASIIRMMHLFLGDDTFKKGLQTYLKTLAYGNAVSDDLWNHLYEAQLNNTGNTTPVNVSNIMNKWSKQTGYPLLTVTRDYNYQTVNLTQNIFLIDSTNITEEEINTLWDIPITWATSSEDPSKWSTYPSLWLRNRTTVTNMIISEPGSWIIVNVQAAGYYRVNYDPINWQMIIEQLESDHTKIDVVTKTQLIDDAFSLAKAGIIPYTTALNMTKYLSRETEYLPFSTALGNIGEIKSMLCRTDVYGTIKQHMLNMIIPNYLRMGWANMSSSSVQEQYLQVEAISLACGSDYPDCVQRGTALFQSWKLNPEDKTKILPNLRKTVYCTGIAHGNSSDWDFVWNRYKTATVPSEKSKLQSSLSCSREMWILAKLLELSLNPNGDISPQDAPSVIASVASTDHGRELAFNFVREKWDVLFKMFGELSFSLADILSSLASRLNTPSELDEFTIFKNKAFRESQVGTAKSAFNQAQEVIGSNIRFMNRSYDEISNWFKITNNVSTIAPPSNIILNTSDTGLVFNNTRGPTSGRLTANNNTGNGTESRTEFSNTSNENTEYNVDRSNNTTSRPTNMNVGTTNGNFEGTTGRQNNPINNGQTFQGNEGTTTRNGFPMTTNQGRINPTSRPNQGQNSGENDLSSRGNRDQNNRENNPSSTTDRGQIDRGNSPTSTTDQGQINRGNSPISTTDQGQNNRGNSPISTTDQGQNNQRNNPTTRPDQTFGRTTDMNSNTNNNGREISTSSSQANNRDDNLETESRGTLSENQFINNNFNNRNERTTNFG